MFKTIHTLVIVCSIIISGLLSVGTNVLADISTPLRHNLQHYDAVASPVKSNSAAAAKPVGLGSFATDHKFRLQVGINRFTAPVDFYLGLSAPSVTPEVHLFNSTNGIVSIVDGIVPWKTEVLRSLSETLTGDIPMSILPSGDYMFFLLAVPAGTSAHQLLENDYIWTTTLQNLRLQDIEGAAIQLFGSDIDAATSMMMALARGYSLSDISSAALAGQLSQYGQIMTQPRKVYRASSGIGLEHICQNPDDEELCKTEVKERIQQLKNDRPEYRVTWMVVRAASIGYSAAQIHKAVYETILFDDGQVDRGDCCYREGETLVNWYGGISVCRVVPYDFDSICIGDREYVTLSPDNQRADIFSDEDDFDDGNDNNNGSDDGQTDGDNGDDDNGVWPDFNFEGVNTVQVNISILVNGERYGSTEGMTCTNCVTKNGSSGDPANLSYEYSFYGSSLNFFGGDEDFFLIGEIDDYGSILEGSFTWEVSYPQGSGAPNGDAFYQLALPFTGLTTVSGNPAVKYGASGIATCNYIPSIEINGNTSLSCNEESYISVKLY